MTETNVTGTQVAKKGRGFAAMTPERQKAIARQGGLTAHQKGVAHEWTSQSASRAGRKGGLASAIRKRAERAEYLKLKAEADARGVAGTESQG